MDGVDKRILGLSFNASADAFCVAMTNGFRIYNTSPLEELEHLAPEVVGSTRLVEVLDRSNLVAVVCGGSNPKYEENTVCLFDLVMKKYFQLIVTSQPVLTVKIRHERIIVVLRNHVHCFDLPGDKNKKKMKKLFTLQTQDNPKGLVAVCASVDNPIMVLPGLQKGSVNIVKLAEQDAECSTPVSIHAHQNELACTVLDSSGRLLATASKKGTLIRVFETDTRKNVAEFRRGSDSAAIYSIAFSQDSHFLCAASDKGTVHVFSLSEPKLNRKSAIRGTGSVLGLGEYSESVWSMASFTVPHELPCICAFVPATPLPAVVALSANGSYYKYEFNREGTCRLQSYDLFLEVCNDHDLWMPS